MAAANNNTSPVWEKILKSFREDLAADGLLQPILEIKSLGELLNDTKVVHPLGFQGRKAVDFMDRLQPTLTVVDEFLALIINCFDTEAALPGLVWGSINMILNVGSPILNLFVILTSVIASIPDKGHPVWRIRYDP